MISAKHTKHGKTEIFAFPYFLLLREPVLLKNTKSDLVKDTKLSSKARKDFQLLYYTLLNCH